MNSSDSVGTFLDLKFLYLNTKKMICLYLEWPLISNLIAKVSHLRII